MTSSWPAYSALAGFSTVALACLFTLARPPSLPVPEVTVQSQAQAPAPEQLDPVQEASAAPPLPAGAHGAAPLSADAGYYSRLRERLPWSQTRAGSATGS